MSSNPKVFEFAKEVGFETLALMDKIREWQLPVKSHMAELDPEMQDEIKQRLEASAGGAKPKAAKKKKKKVAKKATAKKTVAKKTAAKKSTVRKAATVIRRKAAEVEASQSAAAEESAAKTAKRVVSRTETGEEKAPETAAPVEAPETPTVAAQVTEVESPSPAPQEAPAEVAASTEAEAVSPEAPAQELPPAAVTPEPKPEETQPVAAATSETTAPEEKAKSTEEKSKPARMREVEIGASGHASPSAPPVLTGRNIVGRMDLSRVQAPKPSRPSTGPSDRSAPGASRPAGRNIRTGFVVDQGPPMQEEIEGRRRFEDNKKKVPPKGGAPGGPSGRELEEPPQFAATEFRKREMVFQPKKKKIAGKGEGRKPKITTPKASKRVVKVYETMGVSELAQNMGVKAGQVIRVLVQNGVMANMNTELDFDTISLVVPEFGYEAQNIRISASDAVSATAFGNLEAEAQPRPPVVTVMGHVDHGKTSLLDAIRRADVASGEAGGITQHIGAYSVRLEDDSLITFIDTPGHEAFTAMRARGANVTDIAIIVVAADDGVMPQTQEAINHAKAAGVPIIIAVNKIDKAGANPERIRQQMTEYELVPEEWGGNTIFCDVSAVEKIGVKELLEQVTLLAEIQELKANPDRSASGIVIESRLEKGKGNVATVLVKEGTLKVGQVIVAGTVVGKVRGLLNDRGERVTEAGPAIPVEVAGLAGSPQAGDRFDVVKDEAAAADIANLRQEQESKQSAVPHSKMSLDDLFSKVSLGTLKELPVVLKTDVAGSAEAIRGMFDKVGTTEVKVKVIHTAVGGISESDVLLASTAGGLVLGFNVRPDSAAQAMAKREGIEIRTYSIVYELMDDIKDAMSGLLSPDIIEKVEGRAEVRETFSVPRVGTIAGCFVVDGKINRNSMVRLLRDGRVVYEGKISSLKRFKDDAKEVATGYECGIGIENYNDLKAGDEIEAFIKEEVARTLESSPQVEA